MTDVKRLLAEATSLPWTAQWDGTIVGPATGAEGEFSKNVDAELAVYAVNHLPDYLAAVEALEGWMEWNDHMLDYDNPDPHIVAATRAVLARLRDEVPA